MRILVVGSGGREHAIVHALISAGEAPEVYVAPGNAGTSRVARNVDIPAGNVESLLRFARERAVELTIVGPEQPLVAGIADAFRASGLAVVGPGAGAARLEGSKAFAKEFMRRHDIPTARYQIFSAEEFGAAASFMRDLGAPLVVKASGLAAGKGAIVCDSIEDAEQAARLMLIEDKFGEAGREIIIEEFMTGEEASVFAVCDGRRYILLSPAQDHKRVGPGDTGPNTGGMGAYAPAPLVDASLLRQVDEDIIRPTVEGLAGEGTPYNGFLYVGLMIDGGTARVVEYNCRLGDPEAQVVLPLLEDSFVDLMRSAAGGELAASGSSNTKAGASACVVVCSGGYPDAYTRGYRIQGLDEAAAMEDVVVFHAGTATVGGAVVTNGGRVLGVTATGKSLEESLRRAYEAVDVITFRDMYYRRDIGYKGLARLQPA